MPAHTSQIQPRGLPSEQSVNPAIELILSHLVVSEQILPDTGGVMICSSALRR
jgi:hypothetical protein